MVCAVMLCLAQDEVGDLLLFLDLFRLCPPPPRPQLSGCILFAPSPDARAIFLHDDSLCNGTCSVTGGGGGTNGKDPYSYILLSK